MDHWLKNVREIGDDNDYTDQEIEEYTGYIRQAANFLKLYVQEVPACPECRMILDSMVCPECGERYRK